MVINLTPDIEPVLYELAEKQGTTIELLVLKTLRQHLLINKPIQKPSINQQNAKTLADFLDGHVGIIDSREFVKGGAQMSKPKTLFGALKGTITIHGDIISPIDVKWDVLQ